MKRSVRLIVILAAVLTPAVESASAHDEVTTPFVAAVQVVSDAAAMRGTAVLIRREEAQVGATLYFLTSARLFRGPDGNYQRISKIVTLELDETRSIEVTCNDVFSDGSGFADVAILRATGPDIPTLRPTPLAYEPPPVGGAFLLAGVDKEGRRTTVSEHVRFESTLLVVGDRDASPLVGCVGAPAVSATGVFGIVRECDGHRSPVISLLVLARSFLERRIPRHTTREVAPPPVTGERKEGAS